MNDVGTEMDLLTVIISACAAGLVVSFLAGPILVWPGMFSVTLF